MPKLAPSLWFDTQAAEAADYYVSVFPNSRITAKTYYGEAGPRESGMVLTVSFELDGQEFMAINGGPEFHFDEAISFVIHCADQAEVDYYWETLTEGGEENVCGWLRDRFGVSWQVVPDPFLAMIAGSDDARRDRAMRAMMTMKKLDLAAITAAADAA